MKPKQTRMVCIRSSIYLHYNYNQKRRVKAPESWKTLAEHTPHWLPTCCNICSLNCGLEVQIREGHIVRTRGDKAHPISQGYLCEKSQRMDTYQHARDRLSSPMRRTADGSYEKVSWNTAIKEVAARLRAVREAHGGEAILYYGGGGQANHLGATYAESTLSALGVRYRSNALAQEKTGEAWVHARMFGCPVHSDFEYAEVAVLLGKNPWQSHGFPRARVVLKEISQDPKRSLIVIDPRRSETAAMADFHLALRPGSDAWCLAALAAILVQDGLVPGGWVEEHVSGLDPVVTALKRIDISQFAKICDVEESLLRGAAARIARAKSASFLEDLGLQMGVHSTLSSYLNRLLWGLSGHYGRPGTNNAFVPFRPLTVGSQAGDANKAATPGARNFKKAPVSGFPVVMGLIPCNSISEEILTDHPHRIRAMFIESANPVHSLADSQRMREAMRALDFSVVIDVCMTETARQADYVLPACSQFERAEASFFNFEMPKNGFHLRHPLFKAREGTLEEGEIHARILEALGVFGENDLGPLRAAAGQGLKVYARVFSQTLAERPELAKYPSVLLYRTLGSYLPEGLSNAASLFGVALMFAKTFPEEAARAGFAGPLAGVNLFESILNSPSGLIFSVSDEEQSWSMIRQKDGKINLNIQEMLQELCGLDANGPPQNLEYPFILSAGERRTETSNTNIRDSDWHKKGLLESCLRIHPQDAKALKLRAGGKVRVLTQRAQVETRVELCDSARPGHVSLPNGHGLETLQVDGHMAQRGVALNELTDHRWRDRFVGTPWHKYVPVKLEPAD